MFQSIVEIAVYATILGIFITIAAWINGRKTTKEIRKAIDDLSRTMTTQIAQVLEKISEQIAKSEESTKQILIRLEQILSRMDERTNRIETKLDEALSKPRKE